MLGRLAVALFFVGPGALVACAVSARTTHVVESYRAVMNRVDAFQSAAREASVAENVDVSLLLAVAAAESSGDPTARSRAGAVGLMQLRPDTAAELAQRRGESRPDLDDPATSFRLGARYVRVQLDRFGESPCAEELALAAYNAGPEKVKSWLADGPAPTPDTLFEVIRYGETRAYVRRVEDYAARWRGRTSTSR